MAHLSPLNIAEAHGVYVTQRSKNVLVKCEQFLHKPAIKRMHATDNCIHYDGNAQERALTDSCFFISSEAMQKLEQFYEANKPLDCEIDAYGDFLQVGKATKKLLCC